MKVTSTIKEQVDSYLDQLSPEDQERVLAIARHLVQTPHDKKIYLLFLPKNC